jgi:hypothetical protein
MKAKSGAELSRLSVEQADAMGDLCHIYHVSLSSGTYGTRTTESLTIVSGVACGIQFTNGRTVQSGNLLLVDYDALLRLPTSVVLSMGDEVELVEKGELLVSGTFKPYVQPVINSSVQHVQLKRVVS